MVAILPIDLVDVDQAEVGFIDQGACLKAVAGTLPCHATASDAVKLLMDERNQLVECCPISTTPSKEEFSEAWTLRYGHCSGRGSDL